MAKYCNFCKQNVEPVKKFSWAWFVLLTFFTAIGGVIYFMAWAVFGSSNRCPICKGSALTVLPPADANSTSPGNQLQQ
jgi:hypothetical protein